MSYALSHLATRGDVRGSRFLSRHLEFHFLILASHGYMFSSLANFFIWSMEYLVIVLWRLDHEPFGCTGTVANFIVGRNGIHDEHFWCALGLSELTLRVVPA